MHTLQPTTWSSDHHFDASLCPSPTLDMASPQAVSEWMMPLSEATKIKKLDSQFYGANLVSAWCVGSGQYYVTLAGRLAN